MQYRFLITKLKHRIQLAAQNTLYCPHNCMNKSRWADPGSITILRQRVSMVEQAPNTPPFSKKPV